MLSNLNYLLVTATCFVGICTAIRVDWNTNTGPIIPPTPRPTIRPVPPFREPAAVWEDLSNDIPNPNPYIYVPPPPSRPKQSLHTNVNYNSNGSSGTNFGTIVTPQNSNTYYLQNNNNNNKKVASLAPQYIPNVGTRYVAVVPKSSSLANKYPQLPSENSLSPDDKTSYKQQGKYNAKTKKYKAYEKVKYVPVNYYSSFKVSDNATVTQAALLSDKKFSQQELPAKQTKKPWMSPFVSTVTSAPFKTYTKHVYAKDKTTTKPKENFNNLVDKAKKS